jgi:hypothetical protein
VLSTLLLFSCQSSSYKVVLLYISEENCISIISLLVPLVGTSCSRGWRVYIFPATTSLVLISMMPWDCCCVKKDRVEEGLCISIPLPSHIKPTRSHFLSVSLQRILGQSHKPPSTSLFHLQVLESCEDQFRLAVCVLPLDLVQYISSLFHAVTCSVLYYTVPARSLSSLHVRARMILLVILEVAVNFPSLVSSDLPHVFLVGVVFFLRICVTESAVVINLGLQRGGFPAHRCPRPSTRFCCL